MNTVMIHPRPAPDGVLKVAPPLVYVDGRRRRELHAQSWSVLPAPQFGQAVLGLGSTRQDGPAQRCEALSSLPPIGARVQLVVPQEARQACFDGFIIKHISSFAGDGERLACQADDALAVQLSTPVEGRWQLSDGLAVHVPAAAAVFNGDADTLAGGQLVLLNGRLCRLFGPQAGQLWSVADILAYLLAAHVPGGVSCCGLPEAMPAGAIYPPRLDLTGMPLAEALARVAELAGLAVRGHLGQGVGQVQRGLVVYEPARTGRRRAVRLQQAGASLDLRRSNALAGSITFRKRPGRCAVLVLGGLKRYESTFLLKPGWDISLESYRYRDFVRDEAADWPAVADVFRTWVLNESGQYSLPPWNLDRFDLAAALGEDFLTVRPRRFEPCLSANRGGGSQGVVVELSLDGGATWRRYGGSARVLGRQCAVHLADDALGADYFQAALARAAVIRVTATLTADRHLSVRLEGDAGCPLRLLGLPWARWAKVHSGSIFAGRDDLPTPDQADDTELLLSAACSLREAPAGGVQAELDLAWLDTTFNVGDLIDRIDGRGLNLGTTPFSRPSVQAVEHRADQLWSTHLVVGG